MSDDTSTIDAPDDAEFLDTGQVRLTFAGKTITLSHATLGQVKKLKRAYFDTATKIDATDVSDRSDQELDGWVAWLRLVVTTLGNGELPKGKAAEQLPAAWFTAAFAGALIGHWQTRPLPRGLPGAR